MGTFQYSGLHFTPLTQKLKGDFFQITRRLRSVGIGNYPWSHTPYNYDDFYKQATPAGGENADLFLCSEDGLVYVPCLNELMLYQNPNGSAWHPHRL